TRRDPQHRRAVRLAHHRHHGVELDRKSRFDARYRGRCSAHPVFAQDELDKWKARTNPGFLASERLHLALYSGDARSVNAATAESVKRITRDDLVSFYKAYYRPGNALLGVTGHITSDAITAKLDKYLAAWEA